MKLCARICVVLVSAWLGLWSAPVGAQAPGQDAPPGVRNYTRVDATVACAGAPSLEAIPELKRLGFAAVINFRLADEPGADVEAEGDAVRRAGLKYIHVPFNTASPDPAAVAAFLKAVVDPANQPVFIHCGSANRVGAMWLIKRVVVDGWDVEKATTEANAIGLTNPGLRQFALDYVKTRQQ
jgi:uncharacterized protein (TIGR01244 family)